MALLLLFLFVGTVFSFDGPYGLNNGVGRTPQMGWNSWNYYGCNINQTIISNVISAFVTTGLSYYGYEYVNIDDCWQTARMPNGTIIPDPLTFPDGIVPLVQKAHAFNLKFGLYSDAGNYTCQHRPGSLGYETIDADTYAAWGVDYLKYDNCYSDGLSPQVRYPVMRDALNATGRHIFFSMCEWGDDYPWDWAQAVGNSWRTTGDISDNWNSMIANWDHNGPYWAASPGGWNDPDMLEVGNGGMTTTEYITHFSLWCIGKAPLIIGCNVNNMDSDTQMILMNEEAIAINQDPLGRQAMLMVNKTVDGQVVQVYWAPLVNDCYAVLMLNRGTKEVNIKVTWLELGFSPDKYFVIRNLWAHANVSKTSGSYSQNVASHGVSLLKFFPTDSGDTKQDDLLHQPSYLF